MGRIGRFAVIGATVLLVACNMGRDEAARDDAGAVGTAGVSAGDRNFIEESLSANMAEVELGRMAQQRATHPEVMQFAEMMVRDHNQSSNALRQITQQHSIQVQTDLTDQPRDLMDRLSNLSGNEFDREYMDAMIDSHEDMVDQLESRAGADRFGETQGAARQEAGVESSINQWAANALPTTRRHLEEARRIREMLDQRSGPTTGRQ